MSLCRKTLDSITLSMEKLYVIICLSVKSYASGQPWRLQFVVCCMYVVAVMMPDMQGLGHFVKS